MAWLRMFRRKKAEQSRPKPPRAVGRFTECTFCHSDEFYEGPSGGLSQNITCSRCGARFNIGLIPGGPILLDVLSGPTEKCDR